MRIAHILSLVFMSLQCALGATPEELDSLGLYQFRMGKYAEAEATLRQAVTLYKQRPSRDIAGYVRALDSFSGLLQLNGKVNEAKTILHEILSCEDRIGSDKSSIVHALSNLANHYKAEGDPTTPITLLRRALELAPPPAPTRASVLHNLGAFYFDMGQQKKAREFLEQALELNTKRGALQELSSTLGYLAMLAFEAKDENRALSMLDRALTVRREIYGLTHPVVALSINDLAELHRRAGRHEDAAALFQESIQILRATVGESHLYTGHITYRLGECRRQQGRHAEALALFETAITILKNSYGPEHPRLLSVYQAASASASKLKRKREAKEYTTLARQIERSRVPYGRYTIDVSSFTKK